MRPYCSCLIQSCGVLSPKKLFCLLAVPHSHFLLPTAPVSGKREWFQCLPTVRSVLQVLFDGTGVIRHWWFMTQSSSTRTPGRLWRHRSWTEVFWNATTNEKRLHKSGAGVWKTLLSCLGMNKKKRVYVKLELLETFTTPILSNSSYALYPPLHPTSKHIRAWFIPHHTPRWPSRFCHICQWSAGLSH